MGVTTKTKNTKGIKQTATRANQSGDAAEGSQPSPEARVWQIVALIPRGKVATYGQIAALAGMPRHARLVGRTLSQLPKSTRLPWHRVVNASGRISIRAAGGESVQLERLKKEGITPLGGRISLKHYRWDAG